MGDICQIELPSSAGGDRNPAEKERSIVEKLETRLTRFGRLVVWVGLFYVLLLIYRPTFTSPFIYDDLANIVDNPEFRGADAFWQLFRSHPTSMQFDHRPVVGFVSLLTFKVWGLNPVPYHVFNLLVHWLVMVVVGETMVAVARRILLPSPRSGAVAIASIWALHPLNSVTVIYVSQRAESMMALFYVLAIFALLLAPGCKRPGWVLAGSLLAGSLAMGSKEVAITLPLILILLDRVCLAGSFREMLSARKWYYCAIFVISALFIVWWLSGIRIRELGGNVLANPWEYLKIQARVIVNYIRLVLWPMPLIFVYHSRFVTGWHQWLPHAGLLLGLIWTGLVAARQRPWVLVCVASFFTILAPTSSIMPIPQEVAAEWRMYLPSAAIISLAFGTVWGVVGRLRLEPYGVGFVAIILLASGWITFERGKVFATAETLWADVVKKEPLNHRGWANLAIACIQNANLEAAKTCAYRLAEIGTRFVDSYSAAAASEIYGRIALEEAKYGAAEEYFREVLRIDPTRKMARANLALALSGRGDFVEALSMVEAELELHPDSMGALLARLQILVERSVGRGDMERGSGRHDEPKS